DWMRELDRGRGFTLLRGFPVDAHSDAVCEAVWWGLGLHMGRAVPQNTDGDDIIGLFCLTPAKRGGVSRIVSSPAIFNRLLTERPKLAPVLFEPFPFDTQGQQKPGHPTWFE